MKERMQRVPLRKVWKLSIVLMNGENGRIFDDIIR